MADESCIVEEDEESEGLGYEAPLETGLETLDDPYKFMDSNVTLSKTLLRQLQDSGFSSSADDEID